MLVFALDLENVKEVGGGGVDLDQVLIVLGRRVRQLGDLELLGALKVGDVEYFSQCIPH